MEPPFGLHLALRSTDDSHEVLIDRLKFNGTPSLSTELRKLLLRLSLACLAENSFKNRSVGLVGLIVSLKNDRNGRGLAPKWAWLQNFCTQPYC